MRDIDRLRAAIAADPLDRPHCAGLALKATVNMADLGRAADLVDRFTAALATIEIAEYVGADRQIVIEQSESIVDEIVLPAAPA